MNYSLKVAFFLLSFCVFILPQSASPPTLVDGVLSDSELGFRYTPPPQMFDETDSARESVRRRAASLQSHSVFEVILAMSSGDDTDADWVAIGMEAFPRSKLSGLDDAAAAARTNVLIAGARASLIGTPQQATFAGRQFVVSEFEQEEPALTKRARVYSTVLGSKFLSIAFSANRSENVQRIAKTMATLEFSGQPHSYLGFDRNGYPGDENLNELHKAFDYTGYWLNNPPGVKANTWTGKRKRLQTVGFGFLVLFNGRLYSELKTIDAATKLGNADAQSAIVAARREGFPDTTIIFLDQEQGGRMLPEQKAYLFAWVDGVSKSGLRAGIYCSGIPAKEGNNSSVITAQDIRQNARNRQITYWVTNDACPPAPGCASTRPPSPNLSGMTFADVWQYAQSPQRKDVAVSCSGYSANGDCYAPSSGAHRIDVDLNAATSADPSHGRSRD
jgi:hypothetical protein